MYSCRSSSLNGMVCGERVLARAPLGLSVRGMIWIVPFSTDKSA